LFLWVWPVIVGHGFTGYTIPKISQDPQGCFFENFGRLALWGGMFPVFVHSNFFPCSRACPAGAFTGAIGFLSSDYRWRFSNSR
jgi:hypothetical protein